MIQRLGRVAQSRIALGLVTSLLLVLLAWGVVGTHAAPAESASRPNSPLGDALPAVILSTPAGDQIPLLERVNARPALIYVFGAAECASCSQLALEMQIARSQIPGLEPLLVASGADRDVLLPYIRQMGVEAQSLLDEDQTLVRALGLEREPVVLLIDSHGRIIFVDHRSAAKAKSYPVGRLLRDLKGLLGSE